LLQSVTNQLIADMKRSWQKTAILAVLLLVGVYFWIPPLIRAFQDGERSKPEVATAAAAVGQPLPASAVGSPASAQEQVAQSVDASSWQELAQRLKTDPLVQSVGAAAIHSDPFQMDRDQFSPPVLGIFEAEPEPSASHAQPDDATRITIDGLVLKSTIIGIKQRAAFINDRLYFEGNTVSWQGNDYLVTAIESRKVILTFEDKTFELSIVDEALSRQIELQSRAAVTDPR